MEELEAPDFKRNHSTEMIKKRAIEKERGGEAGQNAQPGTVERSCAAGVFISHERWTVILHDAR